MKHSKKMKLMVCVLATVVVVSVLGAIIVSAHYFEPKDLPIPAIGGRGNLSVDVLYNSNTKKATGTDKLTIYNSPQLDGAAIRTYGYYAIGEIAVNTTHLGDWYIGNMSGMGSASGETYKKLYSYHLTDGTLPSSYDVVIDADFYGGIKNGSGVFPALNLYGTATGVYYH